MKIKFILILTFIIGYTNAFNTLTPRVEKTHMTTSVIIPCVARHFFWLSGILESYDSQTVRPDEIVISLSEVEKIDSKWINKLETGQYRFKLKIIRNAGTIIDGENRTIAMNNSFGDILIFSDADDLPHPQRIEITKYIFEHFEVDSLYHSYCLDRDGINLFKLQDASAIKFNSFDQALRYAKLNRVPITSGSPCFLRKVGERLKWHATQDRNYAQKVFQLFENNIVIPLNLIHYRRHLSSHGKNKSEFNKDLTDKEWAEL